MRHIPRRLAEDGALLSGAHHARSWFRRNFLGRPATPPAPRGNPPLPRVEPIWFPYYVIPIEVHGRKGPGVITCSIEAWSGAFAIFQMEEDLVEGPPPSGETVFEPRMAGEEAATLAEKELLHTIMRQRSRGEKPTPGKVLGIERILYPYWVYYYARRPGRLDILVLDGAGGEALGQRTRAGVLNAFVAASKAGS